MMLSYLSSATKASSALRASISIRSMSSVPSWATYDPKELGTSATPYAVSNFVDGKWAKAKTSMDIPHPTDRDSYPIFTVPDTQADEIEPFLESLRKVSKSGKHNPLKNNDRYVKYGEITRKVSSSSMIYITLMVMVCCAVNITLV
jgi:1-pyrroline-5-carboxylate dehydrogenase